MLSVRVLSFLVLSFLIILDVSVCELKKPHDEKYRRILPLMSE